MYVCVLSSHPVYLHHSGALGSLKKPLYVLGGSLEGMGMGRGRVVTLEARYLLQCQVPMSPVATHRSLSHHL